MELNEAGSKLAPHEHRVLDEGQALMQKLEALSAFIKSPIYAALPQTDQILLAGQQSAMSAYLNFLSLRVERFSK